MSNDLISRSEVIKIIEEEMEKKLSYEVHNAQIDIMFMVKELPTAYDVDKVVARLEEMRTKREEQLRTCVDNDMADYLRCKMSAIAEAIEIVKSVGVE